MAGGRQRRFDPGLQLGRHESLILDVGVEGIVGVPWVGGKRRLNDRQVIGILGVQCLEGVEAVAKRLVVRTGLNRQSIKKVVGNAGRRVGRFQDPELLGSRPVIWGYRIIGDDTLRIGTGILELKAGVAVIWIRDRRRLRYCRQFHLIVRTAIAGSGAVHLGLNQREDKEYGGGQARPTPALGPTLIPGVTGITSRPRSLIRGRPPSHARNTRQVAERTRHTRQPPPIPKVARTSSFSHLGYTTHTMVTLVLHFQTGRPQAENASRRLSNRGDGGSESSNELATRSATPPFPRAVSTPTPSSALPASFARPRTPGLVQ